MSISYHHHSGQSRVDKELIHRVSELEALRTKLEAQNTQLTAGITKAYELILQAALQRELNSPIKLAEILSHLTIIKHSEGEVRHYESDE